MLEDLSCLFFAISSGTQFFIFSLFLGVVTCAVRFATIPCALDFQLSSLEFPGGGVHYLEVSPGDPLIHNIATTREARYFTLFELESRNCWQGVLLGSKDLCVDLLLN